MNADTPTVDQCRPHIEKALNTLKVDSNGKSKWLLFYADMFCELLENCLFDDLEPDSAEVVVEVDDSKEKDVSDADDDASNEAKTDLNTDDDDDSKEGI